jgi:hypothetical protein
MTITARSTRQPTFASLGEATALTNTDTAQTTAISISGTSQSRILLVFVGALDATPADAEVTNITSNGVTPYSFGDFVKITPTVSSVSTHGQLFIQVSDFKLADQDTVTVTTAGDCNNLVVQAVVVDNALPYDPDLYVVNTNSADSSTPSVDITTNNPRCSTIFSFVALNGFPTLSLGSDLDTDHGQSRSSATLAGVGSKTVQDPFGSIESPTWSLSQSEPWLSIALEIPFHAPYLYSYTALSSGAQTPSVTVPENPEAGDLLVAVVSDFTATPPAGWVTRVGDTNNTPGAYNVNVFEKPYASETSVSFPSAETNAGTTVNPNMGIVLSVMKSPSAFAFKTTGATGSGAAPIQVPQNTTVIGESVLVAAYSTTDSGGSQTVDAPFNLYPSGGLALMGADPARFTGLAFGAADRNGTFPTAGVNLNGTESPNYQEVFTVTYGFASTGGAFYVPNW